jgi:16S rRNA (guanine966-N2)-methyltransferase
MRVIAGALGGRRLVAPHGHATRPTSDRVREALFSVLGNVSGARVLDLYAGTGALGIEAVSRGATRAVFVENGRPALAALRENITTLDLGSATRVIAQPVLRALEGLAAEAPFDLVLLDPPYAALAEASRVLAAVPGKLTAPDARIVLEHASRDAPPTPAGLSLVFTRAYGDTSVSLYAPDETTREPVSSRADAG